MYYQTDMDMWTLIDTHTMCIQKMTQGRLFRHAYAFPSCLCMHFTVLLDTAMQRVLPHKSQNKLNYQSMA